MGSCEGVDITVSNEEIMDWEKISYKIPFTACDDCRPIKGVERVDLPRYKSPGIEPSNYVHPSISHAK